MTHISLLILAVLIALLGLAYRILSLGSGAARFGFLPQRLQRWFLNGSSQPAQRK